MTEVKMATTSPQQSSNMGDLDHGQTLKAVKSYGIEIDASKIDEVSYENRPENLRELGVNVFDQDVFEEGVLRQVDDAISQLQGAYERQELEKELQKIEKELGHIAYKLKARYIPEKKLENLISENEKLVKKKENILKKLNIETGDVFDDDTECDDVKDNKSSTSEDSLAERLLSFGGHKETDSERCIRLGEMTPFGSVVEETASPKESRVTAQDQSFTQSELNDMDATVIESDDDYIPNDDDLKLSWQDDDISDDNNDYLEGEQQELSLTEIKNLYRKEKKKVVRKNNQDIDDGNDKIYQTRIRRVKLKKSLKEEGIEYEEQSDEDDNISDEEHVDEVFDNGLKIPGKVWSKLFRYQKTGVKWLWELHCQQAGGIVGDEMGLGKTIQIIAFLAGLKYSNLTQRSSRQSGLGPVLVICPATVMYQWVREFHKWWPEFRVAVLHDTGSHQGSKSKLVDKIRATPGILITTYSGVRLNQEYLLPAKWDYVILDEGHIIRNPDAEITLVCKQFRTCHRIILSGSPMQNNLRELWSLFDFVFPGKLGTLPVFMQEFSVPITMGGYANASTVQVQTAYKCACVLRDTINPYLLRRMKKDVKMKLNLPNKNEQVLFCRLTQEQIEVYKEYLASRDVSSILSGNMKVFPGLIMLRKICNHPDLTTEAGSLWKLKKDRESDCQQADEYGHWQRSGKLIVVQSLLKLWKKQKHKVLLFSQTKQMLEILEIFVKSQGYKYFRMDGSTNIGSRQTLVQNFNKDKTVFVFLLTTRVGGLGLNLVGADRVIIFDPDWNPGTDMQAKERAWRVGQKRDVTIYRLLTTGTIEEKIYHRQIFKQFLTNRVLKDPKQRRFFKSNDLFELFTLDTRDDKTSGTETGAIFAGIGCEVEMPGKIATKRNLEIQKHTDLMVKKKKVVSKMKEKTMEILRSQFSSNSTSSKTTVNTPSARNSIGNDRDNPEEDRNVPENNREDSGGSSSENKPEIPECNRTIPDNIRSTSNGLIDSTLNDMRTSSDETRSLPRNHRTETENTRTTPEPLRASSVGHRDQAEKGESSVTAPEAPSSVQNRRVPDKMTSSNPDDVTAGGKVASVTSSSEHKRKSKKTKKAKKNKRSKIEGIHIGHLSHSEEYVPKNEEEETNDHDEQYILRKLFKKSGVHSALQHDTIVESGNADILLVENEAKRVASQAAEALRRSREQCMLQQSRSGLPTWTGQSGYVGSPHGMRKPLFGSASTTKPASTNQDTNAPHFSGESLTRNAGDTETNDEAMSSSILLARMRARNTIGGNQTGSAILTNESNYNQIMAELRQFIASGCSLPGHATTQEILDKFGGRLPINDNAIFRAMLKTICNFDRSDSGQGYWVLKTEY